MHTSTVTVAVLPEVTEAQLQLLDRDLEWTACRGSGNGGQAKQKTSSAIQLWHKPTGTQVRCESERSQHLNRSIALAMLRAKLWQAQQNQLTDSRAQDRRNQVGSGQRGDKRRTIAVQRGTVEDHLTGRRWRYKDYVRGEW